MKKYVQGICVVFFLLSFVGLQRSYAQIEDERPTVESKGCGQGSVKYQRTMRLLNQLTDSDPRMTIQSEVYKKIVEMGESAVPALVDCLLNPHANTNSRKWAARLLGEVGAKRYEEVKKVLEWVVANHSENFQWWHQSEAHAGLDILEGRE